MPTHGPAARYAIREGMELALLAAIQELPGRQRAVLHDDVDELVEFVGDDGELVPHGIGVLEIRGDRIAVIDAFIEPALVSRFASGARSP